MKKIISMLVITGSLAAANTARAETIQGMVTYLDPVNRMMAVRESHGPGDSKQRFLLYSDDLQTRNVKSVKDVELGQMVTVQTDKKTVGTIRGVNALTVSKVTAPVRAVERSA